ncbi:MAG: hypothetical protein PF637_04500 [Spirochaetes bacterium]|jgi:hypothetical protein|nr:hypothetical protein [Spirochaetota bacterium]
MIPFNFSKFISAIGFLPFIGWLFPLYLNRQNDIDQKNAKVSFIISVGVITTSIIITIVDFFSPSTYIIIFFILSTIQYVLLSVYFLFSLCAAFLAYRQRVITIPMVSSFAEKLNI